MTPPSVKEGQWIKLGERAPGQPWMEACVLRVFEEGRIEVAYLQNGHKPIKDEVLWKDDHWDFAAAGPSGGYLPDSWKKKLKDGAPVDWSKLKDSGASPST